MKDEVYAIYCENKGYHNGCMIKFNPDDESAPQTIDEQIGRGFREIQIFPMSKVPQRVLDYKDKYLKELERCQICCEYSSSIQFFVYMKRIKD